MQMISLGDNSLSQTLFSGKNKKNIYKWVTPCENMALDIWAFTIC